MLKDRFEFRPAGRLLAVLEVSELSIEDAEILREKIDLVLLYITQPNRPNKLEEWAEIKSNGKILDEM